MNDAVRLIAPGSAPPRGSREAQGRGTFQLTCPGTAPRLTRLQASTGRGRPPTAPALSLQNAPPPPRWVSRPRSPRGTREPSSLGSGHSCNAQQVCPHHTPWTAQRPAPSWPPPPPGRPHPVPGWPGRASSRGPLLERASGVRGAAAPDSHERGRGCHCRQEGWGLLPSNRQGGSSQEGEAARKKAAPHGKHLPARPQEDPRKHKACSRMFT